MPNPARWGMIPQGDWLAGVWYPGESCFGGFFINSLWYDTLVRLTRRGITWGKKSCWTVSLNLFLITFPSRSSFLVQYLYRFMLYFLPTCFQASVMSFVNSLGKSALRWGRPVGPVRNNKKSSWDVIKFCIPIFFFLHSSFEKKTIFTVAKANNNNNNKINIENLGVTTWKFSEYFIAFHYDLFIIKFATFHNSFTLYFFKILIFWHFYKLYDCIKWWKFNQFSGFSLNKLFNLVNKGWTVLHSRCNWYSACSTT